MTTNTAKAQKPEILCIGFCCHDLYQQEYILGGTASYCSLMMANLGLKTALITSVGSDFLFKSRFVEANIDFHNKPALATTVFENVYQGQERQQYLHARASPLEAADIPSHLLQAPVVKYCPIADEVHPSLLSHFPDALRVASIQGWLRRWDANGQVYPKAMDWNLLEHIDLIVMSKEDLHGFEDALPQIIERVKIVLMTNGANGAHLYHNGQVYFFPVFPIQEVDPTGAGDIFAAAFLYQYIQSQDLQQAIVFAHVAASFVVEGIGVVLPELSAIEKRLKEYVS